MHLNTLLFITDILLFVHETLDLQPVHKTYRSAEASNQGSVDLHIVMGRGAGVHILEGQLSTDPSFITQTQTVIS